MEGQHVVLKTKNLLCLMEVWTSGFTILGKDASG